MTNRSLSSTTYIKEPYELNRLNWVAGQVKVKTMPWFGHVK